MLPEMLQCLISESTLPMQVPLPAGATAPWSFQQHPLAASSKLPCREYRHHLFHKMSCPTSGRRSPVNASSLLPCIKSHPFQKGKHERFAFDLCLKPRDITNKKRARFQQRGTSAALARKWWKLLGRAQHEVTTKHRWETPQKHNSLYQCTTLLHL